MIGTFEGKDIGTILKNVGMKLVSTVGGASGPLYGTAFMKAGAFLNGKTEMDMNDFIGMMDVAIEGIMKRGKAVKGEKTMLDAMIPALDAMRKRLTPLWQLRKKVSSTPRRSSLPRDVPAIWVREVSDIRIRALLPSL